MFANDTEEKMNSDILEGTFPTKLNDFMIFLLYLLLTNDKGFSISHKVLHNGQLNL